MSVRDRSSRRAPTQRNSGPEAQSRIFLPDRQFAMLQVAVLLSSHLKTRLSMIGAVLLLLCAPLSAAMTVTLAESEVTIDGVSPSGRVLLLNVSRVPVGFLYQTSAGSELLEADGTGFVSWQTAEGVAEQSLWFAVETETGLGSFAHPEEVEAEEMELDLGDVLELDPGGLPSRLHFEGRRVEAWLIRPSVGVWRASAVDGGETDLDGADDGYLTLDLGAAVQVDGPAAPASQVEIGDVLVAVDTGSLRFFVTTVSE